MTVPGFVGQINLYNVPSVPWFHEVDVVRHEAVSQHGELVLAQPLPQQIEIDRALDVARKEVLAPVAALRHMMRHVGDDDS